MSCTPQVRSVSVHALPACIRGDLGSSEPGLPLLFTLGGSFPPAHVQFRFSADDDFSGCLAFAGSVGDSAARHLLVTDAGSDAVHVIDIRARRRVGYLAAPGSLAGPVAWLREAPWQL